MCSRSYATWFGATMNTLDLLLKIGGLASFVTIVLGTLFIAFKKNQSLDRGNQAWLQLNGDKESKVDGERIGLIDEHKQTRDFVKEALERARGIQDGLEAFGSKADQIAIGVRKSIATRVQEAETARTNRDRYRREQDERFAQDRAQETFVDPNKPFDPEGTGRFKGRKR